MNFFKPGSFANIWLNLVTWTAKMNCSVWLLLLFPFFSLDCSTSAIHVVVLTINSFTSFNASFTENLAMCLCVFRKLVMTDLWMNLLSWIFSMNQITTEPDTSGFWVQLTESIDSVAGVISNNECIIAAHKLYVTSVMLSQFWVSV